MKNNGFTLIELLGVVTILAMLGLVIVPITTGVIKDSKDKSYNIQINNIKNGASNFVTENIFNLDFSVSDRLGITLGRLKELGYIDDDISDPITRKKFSNDLVIIIHKTDKGFLYTVCTSQEYCDLNVDMY